MDGHASLIALGVVLFAAVIHATLQVALGSLLALYHASLGKHIKKKTRWIAADYVAGVYMMIALLMAAVCFGLYVWLQGNMTTPMLVCAVCILIILAICSWIFYYRTGRTTELWIPRYLSRYINRRAKKTESNVEAFGLGMLTALAEMPFAFILIVIASNSVMDLPFYVQPAAVLIYALIAVSPMTVMRFAVKTGKTVVDIQKWRVKNKTFLRVMTGVLFATLAAFVWAFEVMK